MVKRIYSNNETARARYVEMKEKEIIYGGPTSQIWTDVEADEVDLGEEDLQIEGSHPRDMGAMGWACWKRTARIFTALQVEASHDKEESSRARSDQKARMATDWKEASDQQENHLAHGWRQGLPTSDSWGNSLPCGA